MADVKRARRSAAVRADRVGREHPPSTSRVDLELVRAVEARLQPALDELSQAIARLNEQAAQPRSSGPAKRREILPVLLDEHQAAIYLNVSETFLRADRQKRRNIPFIRLGGKRFIRYRVSDLEEVLDNWRVGGPA